MVQRGRIITLATVEIPPANTPPKQKTDSLTARPTWNYVGPAQTISIEWQVGKMNSTFNGITERKYGTFPQSASSQLAPFSADFPPISLSPLSAGYYDCEIWFKGSFSDLRVIVKNCVKIAEEVKFTLSVAVSPSGTGSVTISPNQTNYLPGSLVTLTAVPAAGYQFDKWTGSISSTSNPVQIILNANAAITAVFKVKQATQYTLSTSVSPAGAGSVTKKPDQATYDSGFQVVVTAVPASGYYFDHWEGNASGSSETIGVRMDGNKSVTAVFKQQAPGGGLLTLNITGVPAGGGIWYADPAKTGYNQYEVVTLQATANSGYTLDYWLVNGTKYTGWKIYITMTQNTTVEVHWKATT